MKLLLLFAVIVVLASVAGHGQAVMCLGAKPQNWSAKQMQSLNPLTLSFPIGPMTTSVCNADKWDTKLAKNAFINVSTNHPSILVDTLLCPQTEKRVSDKDEEARHLIGQMNESKVKVSNYARKLKEYYKDDKKDPHFLAAIDLYIEAQGKYMNYLSQFTEAIRMGHQRHLDEDEEFNRVGSAARKLALDFVERAHELTGAHESTANANISTDGLPSIGNFVDAAIKVWIAWKDEKRKRRNERADRLSKDLAWADWSDIKL